MTFSAIRVINSYQFGLDGVAYDAICHWIVLGFDGKLLSQACIGHALAADIVADNRLGYAQIDPYQIASVVSDVS